jgi:hypothetical protein
MGSKQIQFWIFASFCFLSFAGFGWYQITSNAKLNSNQIDLSSTAYEQVIEKLEAVTFNLGSMVPKDDLTCKCKMDNQLNLLSFEDPQKCGPERNYLQDELKTFKQIDTNGYFAGSRDYSATANILPRKCVLFIMRKFWKDRALSPAEKREADIEFNRTASPEAAREVKDESAYKQDPGLFAKCDKGQNATPERYGHKACVTEDYVNLVYKSLIDVSECLEIPPKFITPKLSNESGLHVNAFGIVNDGGIGQFTVQALLDVAQNFDKFKRKIKASSNSACQRLLAIPGALPNSGKDILSTDAERCHVIATPPNPLRSLIYYGVFYHSLKLNASNAFTRSSDDKNPEFESVNQLIQQAGISGFDQEKIKQMLFVMSYNSGPGRPVVFFKEWLKYRIQTLNKFPINKNDFNMNYWPERAQMTAKPGEARLSLMKKNGVPLSLAEYLFAFKNSLYIPAVKAQANMLDKGLGAETCTENKFLEL